ncbi:MAG: hypothetical protein K6L76_03285 [Agarilytica sp.]
MTTILKRVSAVIVLCLTSSMGYSNSEVEGLSPELRKLLGKEMLALQEGMKAIIPAYTSGDLEEVARIAEKMKSSYIIKQNITREQKRELKSKMPKSFLHRDQTFHKQAGMLEHVAEENHTELVGFYFYKLVESCAGCHSQYATHKFPSFTKEKPEHKHHH